MVKTGGKESPSLKQIAVEIGDTGSLLKKWKLQVLW